MKVFSFKKFIEQVKKDRAFTEVVLNDLAKSGTKHWAIKCDGFSVETLQDVLKLKIHDNWTEEVNE